MAQVFKAIFDPKFKGTHPKIGRTLYSDHLSIEMTEYTCGYAITVKV